MEHQQQPLIHLRPRLQAVADLFNGYSVIADIGCDHGRLSIALLQQQVCSKVIATDISPDSLAKAASLCVAVGLQERVDLRCGDGFSPLRFSEADAVALSGMGGILIAQLLAQCASPFMGARFAVFQPMRGYAELRSYLYTHGYRIQQDRIVWDAGRFYQVFSAVPPTSSCEAPVPLPVGWPEDCFDLGFTAYLQQDPNLPALAMQMLRQHEKRLQTAQGTKGGPLLEKKAAHMRAIIALCQKTYSK